MLLAPSYMAGSISASQTNSGDISDIVNGNNQFALDMFSELGVQRGNVFFSPWSIYSALAIAHEGARGKTAEEMKQMMHLPENDSLAKHSFACTYDKFNAKDAGYTISTANAL